MQSEEDTAETPQDAEQEQVPVLGEFIDFPQEQADGERRWIVLFEEDYENFLVDVDGNLGFLVDMEQAGEVFRLTSKAIADLSHRDADSEEPLRDFIQNLEELLEEGQNDE